MVEILTPRLRLRRARPEDLDALHSVLSNPLAMRYWSTQPHADLGQTREWLERMIASSPDESDDFIVEHNGQVIGKAGCWRIPEVGFIFHPDSWGRGLAFEAVAATIERAFAVYAIDALAADVDPRNLGCLKLLARLGFKEVGRAKRTWHVGDEWNDSVYLTLAANPPGAMKKGRRRPRSPDR